MSHKIKIPPKKELEKIYFEVKSISKTAKYYDTSNPTVRKWLIEYDIPRFSQKEASNFDTQSKKIQLPNKEELESLYKNFSIKDIQKIYGIGQKTLYDWFQYYDIDIIDHSIKVSSVKKRIFNDRFDLKREEIEQDYKKCGCIGNLAKKYHCSYNTIKKLLKMYDIEIIFPKTSIGQNQVYDYIKSLGINDVILNDRKTISPLELDIYIPSKNFAIEYCGNYFHSETFGNKDKNYHLIKHNLCKEKNIKLITIFDSEWKTKNDIIKSIIKNKLGKITNKIYARKTVFKEVNSTKQFENENHLQGYRPAEKYYALYYNNEIVMSLSIGKSRFNKNYDYEIIRMTTKKDTVVVGGISKIFNNIDIQGSILTYSDNRFGDGNGYLNIGFEKLYESSPNYFYFHKSDCNTLYSRNKFQKHKIENVDKNKTEYQNMLDRGYDRIWDCGNSVYVKR